MSPRKDRFVEEEELTQEKLNELAEEAQEEQKAAEEGEEPPQVSEILIQFAAPGSANSQMVIRGPITPDQMGLAGMRLLNQAQMFWSSPLIESIVHQAVGEIFRQMEKAAQEEQVRQMLAGRRGPN